MDRRSGATPMDFKWDSGSGPVDSNSPFAAFATKKRTHSAFNSPAKSTPALREPSNQHRFLFSNTSVAQDASKKSSGGFGTNNRAMPQTPSKTPSNPYDHPKWTTPRGGIDVDLSGADTPETDPDGNSVVATPESAVKSPTKSIGWRSRRGSAPKEPEGGNRRNSFMDKIFHSSKRRDTSLSPKKDPYSHKAEQRVVRRRRKQQQESLSKASIDDLSDDEDNGSPMKTKAKEAIKEAKSSVVASFFSFINGHPDLPLIVSQWFQAAFNLFVVGFTIYLIIAAWGTISADVNTEAAKAKGGILVEMHLCAEEFSNNRCADTKIPAMANLCSNWEKCMNQDADAVGRARVGAQTFAMIYNAFIEQISWKAISVTLAIIFGAVYFANLGFSTLRHKALDFKNQHQPQQQYQFVPPPTPHRYPSGSYDDPWGMGTPWQGVHNYPPMSAVGEREPQPSMGPGQDSPTKRLQFR